MYTLFRMLPYRQLFAQQLPACGVSLVAAELFYKFHSFTLEALAFLATWAIVDGLAQLAGRRVSRQA